MKTFLLLILSTIASHSQTTSVWQTHMIQSQIEGAVGLPELVADNGERPSLPIGAKGSRFELWGIQMTDGRIVREKLIDTTEVGIYLPTAEITIATADPYTDFYRSRVDQPFTVSYKISNLLAAAPTVPTAATKVLVHHYVDLYTLDSFDGSSIESTVLFRSFELETNGIHSISFDATNLQVPDGLPIIRAGRERFVVYALADGPTPQREIAKAEIIMNPVPDGSFDNIDIAQTYKALPPFSASLLRSYPATSTWVEVYDGEYSPGMRGTKLKETLETAGRIYSSSRDPIKCSTFPTNVQPTGRGRKTFVLRASSPFANEFVDNGGWVLDHKTIPVETQITLNGMFTTIE